MTAWTTISNLLVAVGAKPFATTMQALRDNPIAIAEGASGAPKIQDAALDTGPATSDGRVWVGLRTADLSAGAVGSYAFLTFATPTAGSAGATFAGSGLRYSNANTSSLGTPSGTWRLMGRTTDSTAATSTSLFLRIS